MHLPAYHTPPPPGPTGICVMLDSKGMPYGTYDPTTVTPVNYCACYLEVCLPNFNCASRLLCPLPASGTFDLQACLDTYAPVAYNDDGGAGCV